LSYTSFQYAHLRFHGGTVSVDVTNTGKVAGDEVVQVYEHSPGMKQLKGFQRVALKPGERRTIQMAVRAEHGTHIVVGGSSVDERLRMAVK
jgi:beta-glucosidase